MGQVEEGKGVGRRRRVQVRARQGCRWEKIRVQVGQDKGGGGRR